jgi:hypothetical protein
VVQNGEQGTNFAFICSSVAVLAERCPNAELQLTGGELPTIFKAFPFVPVM